MNRRKAINTIVLFSISAAVLPSCGQNDVSLLKFKNFSLDGNEEKLISQLTDAILPVKDIAGSGDQKAHEFLLMMVDDCYEPDKQKKFADGLKQFDQLAKNKYGSSFTAFTPAQKTAWITDVENKKDIPEEVLFFYSTAKRHTVQAFTTSKAYMTDVMKYKMVPGSNFKGCVPVKG